ncbi:hypothetical protein R1sor_007468 [Riccia sorocarpa]|uniref:Major facilitator superfamily (MFS) profile domain-containing protein n=1 Tax=Riccia sorocarpa TaxID=122646 RepID=A0ABD3HTG7_9MARC
MTDSRIVTLLLVNCAALLERADESLLPAVYDEVGRAFRISPSQLGSLTFIRGLVQALASPLAAYLALTHSRIHVVAIGAFAWGVATAALGLCTAFWQAAVVKIFNGIGLAIVVPAIQSIVADMHEEHERGLGFGFLHATGQLGVILGGIFATVLAGQGTILGIDGWRFAFLNVALISVVLGFALLSFANVNDNVKHLVNRIRDGQKLITNDLENNAPMEEDGLWELWKGTRQVLLVPTFQVIVAQGIVGQTPWYAMAFFTLWFELLGFKNSQAAFLAAMLSVGNMFGSVFGGWIGDLAAKHLPNSGRIICSHFSAAVGIPLSAVLLLLIPQDVTYGWLYGIILFLMGFLMSWNSPATNWPIFAEIVPQKLHTTVYAVDLALEKSISALGTPLVGILAERLFGFSTASAFRPDAKNARALAEGVFCLVAVPFSLCLVVISILYWTYPKDRDRARKETSSDLD